MIEETLSPECTFAVIHPRVLQLFGNQSEDRIRSVAAFFGITLETRMGDKGKLLAELTRKMRERKDKS